MSSSLPEEERDEESSLLANIHQLRRQLRDKEAELSQLRRARTSSRQRAHGLDNTELARYSRQVILPDIGVTGQVKLKKSSVLVVGAGGLGCPSSLYLTGAGVGRIGIVDYDDVEITNLHRQLLFTSLDVKAPKVNAVRDSLTRLNENVEITPYKIQFDSSNALDIIRQYDVVVDATDNVATRYLLSDACVIANKPLVSGSALQFEGQLSVYNHSGPCYRCIFPKPPPPETVNNCSDSGVLGAVVGTIGVLQALQAIKVILGLPGVLTGKLLIFDGLDMTFRNLKLRPKNSDCIVCGSNPILYSLIDYEEFCGAKANDKNLDLKVLSANERISVTEYYNLCKLSFKPHLLIDVRSNEEFQMCGLKNAINIPFKTIRNGNNLSQVKKHIDQAGQDLSNIFVICRRGNDSQRAVRIFKNYFQNLNIEIKDVIGGIHAWTQSIDTEFPIY